MQNSRIVKRICIITIVFFLTIEISAAETNFAVKSEQKTGRQILSLNNFVTMISEKLPELKKNKLQIDKAKNKIYTAKSAEDFYLDGGLKYYRQKEYSLNPSFQTDYTKGYTANIGISRRIVQTGSRISSGIDYSKTDINGNTRVMTGIDMGTGNPTYNDMDFTRTYYSPGVYIGITQPILYNAFGVIDRFAKNDAEMKLAIEKLKRKESDSSIFNYYKKIYFDWIEYSERLKILKQTIDNAQKLSSQIKRKYRSGLADNDDVQNTISAVLKYIEQYKHNKIVYDTVVKELSIFIDTDSYEPDNSEFDNSFNISMSYKYESIPFNKTRNCEIYRLIKNNLQYNKEISENKLLPQLDIIGQYKRKAQEDSFSESRSGMNDVDYYIGFSISYPIGNIQSKSEVEEINLTIKEINHEYDISKNQYSKSLESIILSVNGNKEIFSLKEKNIESLRSKYRTERRKYNQARLDLKFLIDTANSIANEELSMLQLKKQIIDIYLNYEDLTD